MDFRLATLEDAEAIRAIYNREVESSAVNFDLRPRSLDDQRKWLVERSGAHVVIVADDDGTIAGFAALSPYRLKPAYNTSVENSIYVDRDHQGVGLGSSLLGELVRRSDLHGFHAIFARIVGGHSASIALHHKHGFRLVGIEREVGRKFARWHDVALMQRLRADEPAARGGIVSSSRVGARAAKGNGL